MQASPAPLVLIAAGGTGGHMFPAEALSREMLERGHRVALVTDRRGKGFGDRLPQVSVEHISAGSVVGTGLVHRARSYVSLALGLLQARRIVGGTHAELAVGFGGYASVPTIMAASQAGVPILLHEQNAVAGRANRMLAQRAAKIATSFPEVAGLKAAERAKTVLTGNPVRPAISAIGAYRPVLPNGPVRILAFGGSQGARIFASAIPGAMGLLPDALRARLSISQQARPDDVPAVREAYARLGIAAEVSHFFEDVPQRMESAHLVICRSGASTVAELTAAGRPAILVPFAAAADDHQTANARFLSEAGGAWLIPERALTPEFLAERLISLLAQPQALARAALCAREVARTDAASRLADLAEAVIRGNGAAQEAAA
ncbi:MAG TPA: undecaprenyldiphospho-muramoylpentapeptide beta-N-acetylglucosaminyltransferase [Alphaproteobacteria bacterium]